MALLLGGMVIASALARTRCKSGFLSPESFCEAKLRACRGALDGFVGDVVDDHSVTRVVDHDINLPLLQPSI